MESKALVILAAGKGTRLGGSIPKAIAPTRDMSLIGHVLTNLAPLHFDRIVVVTGYQNQAVEEEVLKIVQKLNLSSKTSFALQEEQLGTGHAVQCALPALEGFRGSIMIACADMPLVETASFRLLQETHTKENATISFLTLKGFLDNSFGRVVRDSKGEVTKIVEFKDCSSRERLIDETNSGIYIVEDVFLRPALGKLSTDNSQGEFYLTDIVSQANSEGQRVSGVPLFNEEELLGVNTVSDLNAVNRALNRKKVLELSSKGVEFLDPESCYIESTVTIESGTEIGPNVILKGDTSLAKGTVIEGTAVLINTKVGENCLIRLGVRTENSHIENGVSIGPFAHLRPGTHLCDEVRIGNFVEVKNSTLDTGAKASHLTYLGDATVGENVNVGAGTITANYDGFKKARCIIEKDASIGSNSVLVAPVTIGERAYVGAGSVIGKKSVAAGSLTFTRAPLKVIPGWNEKRYKNKK